MKPIRMIFFCSLLFILSACQSSLLTELATDHGGRMFWDDFTDTSGQWPVQMDDKGSFAYADEAYRISVTASYYQYWALTGHAYRDVQVEVDASRVDGPDVNLYGLICRAQDETNFYFFVISSDGYYAVGKVKDNESILLGQEMMAYNAGIAQNEGSNHLRFDCIGSTLAGYIDGEMVALTGDTDFKSGDVGLIAGSFDTAGVVISFDNFVVYKP